jgi:hypothetical protein
VTVESAETAAEQSGAAPSRRKLAIPIAILLLMAIAGAVVFLARDTSDPPAGHPPVEAQSYDDVQGLADDLDAGGVTATMSTPTTGPDGAVQFAYGTLEGDVGIFAIVFQDPKRIEIAVTHNFMAFRDEKPEAPERFLIGPNWFVKTDSLPAAEEMMQVLGGEIKTYTR